MAASKRIKIDIIDAFIYAVRWGTISKMREILAVYGPTERTKIANSWNDEGETPLIVAIKGDDISKVEYLIDDLKVDINQCGRLQWKHLDYVEVPPIFASIMCDISIDGGITALLTKEDPTTNNQPPAILDSVKSSVLLTRAQKIDILELVGAAYISLKLWKFGVHLWCDALSLRSGNNNRPPLPKTPHTLSESAEIVFGNTTEFSNFDELQETIPYHLLQTQSLLVIHRIMSRIHPDPHGLFPCNLLMYGNRWFFHTQQYIRMVDVVRLTLESFPAIRLDDEISSKWSNLVLTLGLFKTVHCVKHGLEYSFESIMEILRCFSDYHVRLLAESTLRRMLTTMISCAMELVANLLPLNREETVVLKKWLCEYMRDINRFSGVLTPLQDVFSSDNFAHDDKRQRLQFARLLLEAQANPTAADEDGNAPLHFLAIGPAVGNDLQEAVQLLLDYGAHLDQPNAQGKTPLMHLKRKRLKMEEEGRRDPYLDSLCATVLPLKCLCAKVIRESGIVFKDNELVYTLRILIQTH